MSRVYVFATRWVDSFWGNNAKKDQIEVFKSNEKKETIDIKTKCSENNEIRFVGFNSNNFDKIGRSDEEINQLLDKWSQTFKNEEDDITFILHDKVLGRDGEEFKYQDRVFGFYHDLDEEEFISKFLMHCSCIPIADCESILKWILNIISLYDEIASLKVASIDKFDQSIYESLYEKYKELFDNAHLQYSTTMTYGCIYNPIENYVNSLIL